MNRLQSISGSMVHRANLLPETTVKIYPDAFLCFIGPQARTVSSTSQIFAMKPGTPIPGLDFRKDRDPPVALKRSEYPEWVSDLAKKDLSLAKLRRMPVEEATDKQKMRYIKLTRRMKIKERNEESKT